MATTPSPRPPRHHTSSDGDEQDAEDHAPSFSHGNNTHDSTAAGAKTASECSTLDSPDMSTSSSHDSTNADSLLDATSEEVEARALELLATSTPDGGDNASMGSHTAPTLDPLDDLPRDSRRLWRTGELKQEHDSAVAFLRQCVERAEDNDWMYTTPSVFAPPRMLDPRAGAGADGGVEAAAEWMDRAFNLDAYGIEQEEERGRGDVREHEQEEPGMEQQSGSMFGESDVNALESPYRTDAVFG